MNKLSSLTLFGEMLSTNNMSFGVLLLVISLLAVSACSNKQIYEGVQQGQRNECLKLPPDQQEDCLQANSQSYEDYQAERKDILEDGE